MTAHTAIYFYQRDPSEVKAAKDEYPDYSDKQVRDHLKEVWDELEVEDREPYEEKSRESKANSPKNKSSKSKSPKSKSPKSKSPKSKAPKSKSPKNTKSNTPKEQTMRPKKAKTAFFCYLYDPDIRSAAAPHVTKESNLTSVISAQWRELEEEGKQKWRDVSEQEKAELQDNPVLVAKKSSPSKKSSARDANRIAELEKQLAVLAERVAQLE
jgi:hypothetical protein